MRVRVIDELTQLAACDEALDWVAAQERSPRWMWEHCPDPAWMIWLSERLDLGHKFRVKATIACAREMLPYADKEMKKLLRKAMKIVSRPLDVVFTPRDTREGQEVIDQALEAERSTSGTQAEIAYMIVCLVDDAYTEMHPTIAEIEFAKAKKGCKSDVRRKSLRKQARIVAKHIPWKLIAPLWKRWCKEGESDS